MPDYLMRDAVPLTPDQWQRIDEIVIKVARETLVGRRFLALYGPLGAGHHGVALDAVSGISPASVDTAGTSPGGLIRASGRCYLPLPLIYKDFELHWRDIELSRQTGVPLDLGPAAAASALCARAEDDLIFNGSRALGIKGLMNSDGRASVPMSDWKQAGAACKDVAGALAQLQRADLHRPYVLVVSQGVYPLLARPYAGSGSLEIEVIKQLADGGVFWSPVLSEPSAVLVASAPEYLDLAVGQDLTTAYLESQNMIHRLRVLESVVLRVREPRAICAIGPGTGRKAAPRRATRR
jgi:uncharacterized linocin/CFP29 family protein